MNVIYVWVHWSKWKIELIYRFIWIILMHLNEKPVSLSVWDTKNKWISTNSIIFDKVGRMKVIKDPAVFASIWTTFFQLGRIYTPNSFSDHAWKRLIEELFICLRDGVRIGGTNALQYLIIGEVLQAHWIKIIEYNKLLSLILFRNGLILNQPSTYDFRLSILNQKIYLLLWFDATS